MFFEGNPSRIGSLQEAKNDECRDKVRHPEDEFPSVEMTTHALCAFARARTGSVESNYGAILSGVPNRLRFASKRRRISTSSSSYSIIVPPFLTEI